MILEMIQKEITGEIKNDPMTLQIYSVDASIYEIVPFAVVYPKCVEDIQKTVLIAAEYGVPIIPRGGATGIAGGCIGKGLIIDSTKYMNQILELNIQNKYAICEPGVIQDQLNQAVFSSGLRLGPDTSTGNRATLAGMAASNAAGAHFLHYGNMADHLLEVQMVLADGSLATFNEAWPSFLKEKMELLSNKYHSEIEAHFPKIKRRASGYLLDRLFYPAQFLAGSEGSLGIMTQIKVKLSPQLPKTTLSVFSFDSLEESLQEVSTLLSCRPFSLELIDEHVISMGKLSPGLKGRLNWLPPNKKALLIAEFKREEIPELGSHQKNFFEETAQADIWALRKAGLGLLLSRRSYSRAIAFIEDLALPPEHLVSFVKELKFLLKKNGKEAGFYGHAGDSCLHIRPYLDLRQESERIMMQNLMEETTELIKKYNGVLSGEHGDGIIRSWLNPSLFGATFYRIFQEIKQIFDPLNLMNPGKIIHELNPLENLRFDQKPEEIKTFLNFEKEGGFHLAVDLCNGNGECRKKTGLMCPSFHGENDERMTTRARAQSLRAILNGRLPLSQLSGNDLYNVLEYCLECKGCKTECPSQVDMAKIKSEVLFHYHQKNGYSLRDLLFGKIGKVYQLSSFFPSFTNWATHSELLKRFLKISPERSLPKLANTSFSKLWKTKNQPPFTKKVVLFIDTFTEFLEPKIGLSAIHVLNSLGFSVIAPSWTCCGRPALSKGMLTLAKKQASTLINQLFPFAEQGIPILGLEPSCLFTLKDDYPTIFKEHFVTKALKIASFCIPFEEFIAPHLSSLRFHQELPIYIHTHCHQKSFQKESLFLKALSSFIDTEEIPSGCCGMAGSFGYEKEHYSLSMQIGNAKLFPFLTSLPSQSLIASTGFSCRCQIAQGTGKKAYHLAELLSALIK